MKTKYWAYLDWDGKIHLKKYTTDKAIQNCEQMPFCRGIFDPFEALNAEDARNKIWIFLKEMELDYKKLDPTQKLHLSGVH